MPPAKGRIFQSRDNARLAAEFKENSSRVVIGA
jgi:hypothetical protein